MDGGVGYGIVFEMEGGPIPFSNYVSKDKIV